MLMSLPIDGKSCSLVTLTLPSNYGYCIFLAIGSTFLVSQQYKRLKRIELECDSKKPEGRICDNNSDPSQVHEKIVLEYPQFLGLLLLGGLDSPVLTATGGAIYLFGQAVHAYTIDKHAPPPEIPVGKIISTTGWMIMLLTATKFSLRLLRLI